MANDSTYFVDSIRSIGVHNGVVHIQFFKLSSDGSPQDTVELLIPSNQVKSILDGLAKVAR